MTSTERLHLLFSAYMAGGARTILQNLEEEIGKRGDVASTFVPIEMDEQSQVLGKIRKRSLIPGSVRNSMMTGRQIRLHEGRNGRFDAAYFYPHTICILLWRFRRRVPYVVAMDGTPIWYAENGLWYALSETDPNSLGTKLRNALIRRVYQGAFHLLPQSSAVRDSLIRDYGVPPERITVMPPGINLSLYVAPDRRQARGRERPVNVLFVGADFERKGGDLLLEVARMPDFRDVQFHLVSRSFKGTKTDNVHVHEGIVSNSPVMLEMYRQADVFALPTRADSFSVSNLEAMAMGLPIITTAVGGIGDIVSEGETGYFVPPGDAAALADRLRRLQRDPELRIRMGEQGRRRVEDRFNGETIASDLVALMKRAAASRKST